MIDDLNLFFDPHVNVWIISAFITLALVGVLIGAVRSRQPWVGRFAFLALVALAALNPTLIETQRERQDSIGLILVDDSASQTVTGRSDRALESASAFVERAQTTAASLKWRVVRYSQSEVQNSGDGTGLIKALQSALADIPISQRAGALLITDGQISDEALLETRRAETPVHALITGPRAFKDRRIEVIESPAYAEVGRAQTLKFMIEDTGYPASEAATIEWQVNDGPVQAMTAMTGTEQTIEFATDHRGQNVIDLKVSERTGEATTVNNRVTLSVSGVRNRLRVVLVSGEPYQGERLWRATLKSDPSVDLVHFTILRLPTSRDVTPVSELSLIPFPTQELFERNLSKFDLVIFDRYSMRGVLQQRYLANLADYVKEGGALLVAVGPEYGENLSLYTTPLGDVLPVAPRGEILDAPFKPSLTDLGKRHPVTAGLAPRVEAPNWGPWFRLSAGTPVSGQTVMDGPLGLPLVVLDRQGEGRVAMVMSDQSWVWGRGIEGGGPYSQLVRRLVHWLMAEPDLEEEHLSATAKDGTLVIKRRSLQDQIAPVILELPDGTSREITLSETAPGLYETQVPTKTPGLYRLSDNSGTSLIAVGTAERSEIDQLKPTPDQLAAGIAKTGGGILWEEDGLPTSRFLKSAQRYAGSRWFGFEDKSEGAISSIRQDPVLPGWAWLMLLGSALAFTWWREAR